MAFFGNVWVAKKDTKHSSNTLLRLVSFFTEQTLLLGATLSYTIPYSLYAI